jgi:hypothetical protein
LKSTANGTTYFVYDGGLPLLELNAGGGVQAVNTFGANGLLSRYANGSSRFHTLDPQGNVCQRLNSYAFPQSTPLFPRCPAIAPVAKEAMPGLALRTLVLKRGREKSGSLLPHSKVAARQPDGLARCAYPQGVTRAGRELSPSRSKHRRGRDGTERRRTWQS